MPEVTLAVEAGRTTGSAASGRLRRAGKVPAVLYGHGIDPVAVAVESRDLRAALTTSAGLNALLDLKLDGATHLAMARDLRRDPIRGTVTHVDFLIVRHDEVVTAEVPIQIIGEAIEVHRGDGVVEQQLFALPVLTTPGRIPGRLEVDVSALAIGDTIRVSDIALPEGVSTDLDPETGVVVGQPPQVTAADLITEEEAAAAAEAAEAAAAAAEEGEAEGAEGAPAAASAEAAPEG